MTDNIFETDRLYMRMPVATDAQAMQNIKETNWPELQKWMNWASDDQRGMDATIAFITKFVRADREKGGCILFAFHKQTHDLVMVGGLNATDQPGIYATGYWGNIDYLGHGYATEMTKGTLDYAFNRHGAKKIVISYFDDNELSRRVIEKCGFMFVETKTNNHRSHATGKMMDEHCYALTQEQWRGKYVP